MATREIPRQEWTTFFDSFSKQYVGRSATVEVTGQEIGDQVEAQQQVFSGISADLKDHENRIAVIVGPSVDEATSRTVDSPTEVWLKEGDGQAQPSLEIRSSDGTATLLTLS